MRKLILLALMIAVIVGAWWWQSPILALKTLGDAAEDRDAAKLAEVIDLPAFRASLKEELREIVEQQARGNPIAAAAGMIAIDRAVDELITAEGIASAMANEPRDPLLRNIAGALGAVAIQQRDSAVWDIDRGFDTFTVTSSDGAGQRLATLLFARHGLGWKLSGVDVAEL